MVYLTCYYLKHCPAIYMCALLILNQRIETFFLLTHLFQLQSTVGEVMSSPPITLSADKTVNGEYDKNEVEIHKDLGVYYYKRRDILNACGNTILTTVEMRRFVF